MNSMPEPTNTGERINDTRTPAERLLDDTMRRWATEYRNWLDQTELRLAALRALEAWGVDSPEQGALLLQSWARRPEMTDASVADVLEALFPVA
jgi:hypothetical protein